MYINPLQPSRYYMSNSTIPCVEHFSHVNLWKCIKTHGSVSCGPRKRGVRKQSEYINRNNKVTIFTHPQLRDVLSNWHQIYGGVSLHVGEATFQVLTKSLNPFPRYESAKFCKNFIIFFSFFFPSFSLSFCTLYKNCYNLCMRASIWLKFGTLIGGLQANTSIDFEVRKSDQQ